MSAKTATSSNGLSQQLAQSYDNMKQRTREEMSEVTHYIEDHPTSTILATFAIGFIAGTCLAGLLSNSGNLSSSHKEQGWWNDLSDKLKNYRPDMNFGR